MSSIAIPQRPTFVGGPDRLPGGRREATPVRGPALRAVGSPVVAGRTADQVAWRRFLVFLAVVLVAVVGAVGVFAMQASGPTIAERTDGHVMVEPHRSLWEIAVATAPAGVEPSAQLAAIEAINAGTIGDQGSWRVVLLPAW